MPGGISIKPVSIYLSARTGRGSSALSEIISIRVAATMTIKNCASELPLLCSAARCRGTMKLCPRRFVTRLRIICSSRIVIKPARVLAFSLLRVRYYLTRSQKEIEREGGTRGKSYLRIILADPSAFPREGTRLFASVAAVSRARARHDHYFRISRLKIGSPLRYSTKSSTVDALTGNNSS